MAGSREGYSLIRSTVPVFLCLASMALCGCHGEATPGHASRTADVRMAGPDHPREEPRAAQAEPRRVGRVQIEEHTAGRSVEGRPITYQVMGDGARTVLIIGAIHGNEPASARLVRHLGEHLASAPSTLADRRVILLAVANPDGLAAGTRHNVRGVDLNRNFPASNRSSRRRHGPEPLSEPESRALHALLEHFPPDQIISIHQPINCVDFDGPGRPLAEVMAATGKMKIRKLGGRPGSLGSYAGVDLGIPIVTLELPGSATGLSDDALWSRYGPMTMAAIRYPEPIETANMP